ncbi:MAG: hypothetical protein HYV26_13400, partial [Candidatus Hydrogenedentes bacterium]|nr:hypothetical protein [Candidatus Hydrogenedentota bacterium]
MKFYREHIAGRPKLITVVGDPAKMDLEQLKQISTLQEVPLDAMFVK